MPIRSTVHKALKRMLPQWVLDGARGCRAYLGRLTIWARVITVASGRTAKDSAILRASAIRAPIDALQDLGAWRDPMLIRDADIKIRGLGIFAIRGASDDLGHVLPFAHAGIFAAMQSQVRPGDVVLDAGANIGALTVYLGRQVGSTGRVIAIEMMEETAARLRRNLALNDMTWVTVVEAALAAKEGETVTAEVAEGYFGQASIAAGANAGRDVRRTQVRTTTIDSVAENLHSIALMKMDLEGAEPQALEGAVRTLKKTKAVVFESWAADGGETAMSLAKAGFESVAIDGRNFLAVRRSFNHESLIPKLS